MRTHATVNVAACFFCRLLIKSVEMKSPYPWHGMMYACLLFLVTLLRGLLCTHWLYWCDKAGMHLRSLITSTVYRKVGLTGAVRILLLIFFFSLRYTQFPGNEKIRYAIQKVQKSIWNEPYSSFSFTNQSCSKMALYR